MLRWIVSVTSPCALFKVLGSLDIGPIVVWSAMGSSSKGDGSSSPLERGEGWLTQEADMGDGSFILDVAHLERKESASFC